MAISTGKSRLPHTPTRRVCYLCRRTDPNEFFIPRSSDLDFFGMQRVQPARFCALSSSTSACGTYALAERTPPVNLFAV